MAVSYPLKWITQTLAVGYSPKSQQDLDEIKGQHIGAIVNLCAECYDLNELEEKAGFEVYYLPIPDEGFSDISSLEAALSWTEQQISNGNRVLVHCRFGIGRTGTFVVCFLLKAGQTLDTALEALSHTPSRPMSREQWRIVQAYTEKIGLPKDQKLPGDKTEMSSKSFFDRWRDMSDWFNRT